MYSSAITRRWQEEAIPFAVAALAVAIAASMFYTPLPFVILLAIPSCYYFSTQPYELLLVMAFLIPFNFIFKVGPVPVAAELLKVAAWIPLILTRNDRPGFVRSRFDKWVAVIAALIVLSLVRAHDFPYTVKECVRLGSNVGLLYLCLNLIDTREKLLQVLKVFAVSTFVVALYGFYQWMIQDYGALFWIVNPRLDTSLAHYRDYFWEWRHRIISVLTSEMELGHYFNLCLPIGLALWLTEGRKRLESKWLWMTLCMLAGLVLTFTFNAWLALVATFSLFVFLFGGEKRWKVILAGVLILLLLAVIIANSPLYDYFEAKISGSDPGSIAWDAATRLYGWKLALQTWWSHPFLGVGIGNFEFSSISYDYLLGSEAQGASPHEAYFYLMANLGLAGIFSVLAIMWGSIRSNIAIMRSRSHLAVLALALGFAIATNLMGWFADDSGFFGPHAGYALWLLVGLSEALRRMQLREQMIPALVDKSV